MRRGVAFAAPAVVALVWAGLAGAQVEPVPGGMRAEGIAAVVGGTTPGTGTEVILQSDVELRARIHLAGQASGSLPTGRVSEGLLRATLDELIGEVLIAREAERVRIATPSDEGVAEERARLQQDAGGQARLRRLVEALGASMDEVEAMARRRATVQAFLRANLEGSTVVTDAELERVFEAGGHPFEGRELAEVEEELRAWVARQALERAVKRWVSVLRERTRVRLLAPYAEPNED